MDGSEARIGAKALRDRAPIDLARSNAKILFEAHGANALAVISAHVRDPSLGREQRRYFRLLIGELERLDRHHRSGKGSSYLILWKPRFFRGIARFLARIGRPRRP